MTNAAHAQRLYDISREHDMPVPTALAVLAWIVEKGREDNLPEHMRYWVEAFLIYERRFPEQAEAFIEDIARFLKEITPSTQAEVIDLDAFRQSRLKRR